MTSNKLPQITAVYPNQLPTSNWFAHLTLESGVVELYGRLWMQLEKWFSYFCAKFWLKTLNKILVIFHFAWLLRNIYAVLCSSYDTSRVQPWTWNLYRGISRDKFEIDRWNSCRWGTRRQWEKLSASASIWSTLSVFTANGICWYHHGHFAMPSVFIITLLHDTLV